MVVIITRKSCCSRETARCRCKFRYTVFRNYKTDQQVLHRFITIDGQVVQAYLSRSQQTRVIRATWYESSSDGTSGPCYEQSAVLYSNSHNANTIARLLYMMLQMTLRQFWHSIRIGTMPLTINTYEITFELSRAAQVNSTCSKKFGVFLWSTWTHGRMNRYIYTYRPRPNIERDAASRQCTWRRSRY